MRLIVQLWPLIMHNTTKLNQNRSRIRKRISNEIKPNLRIRREELVQQLKRKVDAIDQLAKSGYVSQESAKASFQYFQEVVDATKLDEGEEFPSEYAQASPVVDNNALPFSAQRVLGSSLTWQNLGQVVLTKVFQDRTEEIPGDLGTFVKPFLPAELVTQLDSALGGPKREQVRNALVSQIIHGVRNLVQKKNLSLSEQDIAALEVALLIHFDHSSFESAIPQKDRKAEVVTARAKQRAKKPSVKP